MNHRAPLVQHLRDIAARGWLALLLGAQLLALLISAWRSHHRNTPRGTRR